MAKAKIYSVQPRFKTGNRPGGWSLVDGIFRLGAGQDWTIPPYGTEVRDLYLSVAWQNEPMLSGAFSTWIEMTQTANWKVIGGRNNARLYANMFVNADDGAGWTVHQGWCAGDYLYTDKGSMEELGRQSAKRTTGRVLGINQLDSARLVRLGQPGQTWRYYPEMGKPVTIPDENLIQVSSMPQGRDRFRGLGYCAMSRLYDAKQLMLGYLTYFRQEIGDLPPELAVIINGLPATTVDESLTKYKADREGKGNTIYPKIWWLGSDDPAARVEMSIHNLTTPNKNFSYSTMIEWWIKVIALGTGVDVGEYWLLQSGESKTVQSIQALKSRGKGTAKYLQEQERRYNLDILPYGVTFEYDNTDDEQDRARADILAVNLGNLEKMANMGVQRQELVFELEEIRQMAVDWNVIPPEMAQEEVPSVIGSSLKQLYSDDVWVVDRGLNEWKVEPLLKGKEARKAKELYHWFGQVYGGNGHMQHQPMEEVAL